MGLRRGVAVLEAAAVRRDSCVKAVRDGACYPYFLHGAEQLKHQLGSRRVLRSKLGVLGIADVVIYAELGFLADLAHSVKQLGVCDVHGHDGLRLELLLLQFAEHIPELLR